MLDMSRDECLSLLADARVGHIALVAPDGKPYAIPVRFVWHNQTVFLRLAYDGRKQDAIEHCRLACFETDVCRDDFSQYASVVIDGTLEDVTDESEKLEALVAFNDKYHRLAGLPTPGPNPVTKGVAIRKVIVNSLTGRKREPDSPPPLRPTPFNAKARQRHANRAARTDLTPRAAPRAAH